MEAADARRSRLQTVLAFVILILALGLRLYFVWHHNFGVADTPARLSADEPGYDNLARDLLAGRGFTWPGRVPLYPLWVAALHYLTGFRYSQIFYVQAFVGAFAVVLTWLLGRRLFGETAGLIAALGAAVDIVLVRQSGHLLSEILFTPAVIAVALSLSCALESVGNRPSMWTGLWIGVANLIRPTLLLFPLWAGAALLVRHRREGVRSALIVLAVSIAVVTPWMLRNYWKYRAVFPLATSNAILWQGSPEYFHLIRHRGYSYLDVWRKVIYGPGNDGHDPGSVEGDRYWTRRALSSIAGEPLVYARFCIEKAATYWVGDPNADWGDSFIFNYHALRRWGFSRWETAQFMASRAFPIVALLALFVIAHRRPLAGIVALLAYCTLLHALTHAEARLSDPLHPLLWIVSAGASVSWRSSRGGR